MYFYRISNLVTGKTPGNAQAKWLDFKNMNFVETWVSIRKVEHKCVDTGVQAVSHPLHTAAVNIGGPGRAVNCQSNVFLKE